ncbi:MAG: ATP-grasp domain-containing protein [Firmicutes bacterium]|nr:ATP-grasp domain-containing protein [Bacillota bacterium]
MRIAIVTDRSRMDFLPPEEALQEDAQKHRTVEQVQEVLSKHYDCIALTADDEIISKLRAENIDLVFNLCNGLRGDSKTAQLPAMLEFAGIAYTGSAVVGHTLAINKLLSLQAFQTASIPTPKFAAVYSLADLDNLNLEFPIIVKPNDEGSSRGIHQDSLIFDWASLRKKVAEELELYRPPILLNEFIKGREFTIGVVGNEDETEVLPIQELDLSALPEELSKFYSFEVKTYYKEKTIYHLPAPLTAAEKELIEKTAIRAYQALMIRDYGRVDIRLKDGIPYVLEINSLPGLQKGRSSLWRIAEAKADLGYEGLILRIVSIALRRYGKL